MKYLVARGLAQVLARVSGNAPMPLQVLEKLPGFAGNTNVIEVTAKSGTPPA
ncbi:hypothetical protein [Bradyrhizobium guangdongense]|uniref:hypothetical protein n=1 Tax=Bradyrhizobium guangdongense TaxID=1325090 RepID=UPI0016429CD5|nr:hypothetical protein [Bradyrhizobium guangdongense]